jgi:hypothetical protein
MTARLRVWIEAARGERGSIPAATNIPIDDWLERAYLRGRSDEYRAQLEKKSNGG